MKLLITEQRVITRNGIIVRNSKGRIINVEKLTNDYPNKDKYDKHKSHAKEREIEFLLTFDEWMKIWIDSGHWHERGATRGKYVMARIGDVGPYQVGNVKIILHEENLSEKKWSDEARLSIGRSKLGNKNGLGKRRSLESKEKSRQSALLRWKRQKGKM